MADCRDLHLSDDALRDFSLRGLNEGRSFDRSSGYMRLNAACPRSILEQAMHRLKKAVDDLVTEGRQKQETA